MIIRNDLRQIVMLNYMTDEMLDKIIPITDLLVFDVKEIIFCQGEKADRFYMLKRGKVILEQRFSDHITVQMDAIKPGFSFGWSSMLDADAYTSDAISDEQSEVFSIRADKLKNLCDADHSLGYILSQRLLRVIKKRYDRRTEQFIRAIKNHPDMQDLFS